MQFALCVPNFGPFGDARTLADLAQSAEESGWDGVFIWDHIAGDKWSKVMVDPWVALAAMAMQTRHIRLGAMVTPLPRRRPWKVAREAVSLDHLSRGRLVFGAGIGGVGGEWERLGEESDMRKRGEMLDEALEIITRLWSGERVDFQGKHYKVTDQQFLPLPLQSTLPIWLAGAWPNKKPFMRALRYDGAFPILKHEPSYTNPPEEISLQQHAEIAAWIKPQLPAGRHFDLVCRGQTRGDGSDIDRVRDYAGLGYTWWSEHLIPENFGGHLKGEWPIQAMLERVYLGPPEF